MNNYTTETYQTKRDILRFVKKITKGLFKPTQKLAEDMIYGILSSRNVSLTGIGRSLKEKIKLCNTVDRLSNNLQKLDEDFKKVMIENYYKTIVKYFDDDYVIVVNDDTDLNKEHSKKLEDLCIVKDASNKEDKLVNGYKVCEYVGLAMNNKTPISLYSRIYSTISKNYISEADETIKGENKVIDVLRKFSKIPVFIRDRGYDSNIYFVKDIKEDNKFVTRLKGNRFLLFKDKERIVRDVAKERKGKILTKLMYKGENKECYISYTKVKLPSYRKKEITLVTVHGLNKEDPMMLLTNLDVKGKDDAERVVRMYFLRWRVEEYFKAKKTFNWENSLLRTLKSMNNLNMFLTMSLGYLGTLSEKLDSHYNANVMLERAKAIKKKALVYLSWLESGLYEILKKAHSGIREWRKTSSKEKYKQLQFDLE